MKPSLLQLVLMLCTASTLAAAPLGGAFTYQGRLLHSEQAANGLYEMQFTLYDAATNGNPVGVPIALAPVPVTNGLFTVPLNFGVTAFNGAARYLEITMNLYGSDGVPTTLVPRQTVTATPYALHAVSAGSLMSSGTNSLDIRVNGERLLRLERNSFFAPNVIGGSEFNTAGPGAVGVTIAGGGNGSAAAVRSHEVSADYAAIGGGAGNAIHTNADFSTISGGEFNYIRRDSSHGTISGGENNTIFANTAHSTIGGGVDHKISAHSSTIGGGLNNTIATNASYGTVGGGYQNTVSDGALAGTVSGGGGNALLTDARYSTIAGGEGNAIYGSSYSSIVGGQNNTIETNSHWVTVAGEFNLAGPNSHYTTIAGGSLNAARSPESFIGGGRSHAIQTNSMRSVIGGGGFHRIASNSPHSTIAGGNSNIVFANSHHSTIGGGSANTIGINSISSAIGGGELNAIGNNSGHTFIGAGGDNKILDDSYYSVVAGGLTNYIGTNSHGGVIVGGIRNAILANAQRSTIGGGHDNTIGEGSFSSTIAGGLGNSMGPASGSSAILGGVNNRVPANAPGATIVGGSQNSATNQAFAAGTRAKAVHSGAFVWADSQDGDFASTTNNEVSFRCRGGVRFASGVNGAAFQLVTWTPGSAGWNFSSDRNLKEHVESVDSRDVLEKVSRLPLAEWNYKGYPQRHIGPMAQDFHALFPLNDNATVLDSGDLHGISLAAIQGLNQKLQEELKRRETENAELNARIEKLERLISKADR